MSDSLKEIMENVIKGKADRVKELTQIALNEEIQVQDIFNDGLIRGMGVVGERFKKNEIFIPEVLLSGQAMKAGMNILKPLLSETGVQPLAKVAIGTVKGDVHDIGKSLVAMMMEGAGLEVMDLGVDVAPERDLEAVRKDRVKLIGMSALLTTTMAAMNATLEVLEEAGLRNQVKTLIGGAPVTQDYADEIGADGYAPDAASGVEKAKELLALLKIGS